MNDERNSCHRQLPDDRDRESQHQVINTRLQDTEVRADKAGMQEALGSAASDGNVEVARTLISASGAKPGPDVPHARIRLR